MLLPTNFVHMCERVSLCVCPYVCPPLECLCKARFSAFISWLIYVVTFAFVLTITLLEKRQSQECVCVSVFVNQHAVMLLFQTNMQGTADIYPSSLLLLVLHFSLIYTFFSII